MVADFRTIAMGKPWRGGGSERRPFHGRPHIGTNLLRWLDAAWWVWMVPIGRSANELAGAFFPQGCLELMRVTEARAGSRDRAAW
jgi:hypothetical protein